MANEISLITFAGASVAPQDDAIIYESALGTGGVYYGCQVTLASANTLHIAAGHGVICGRKFTMYESNVAVQLASSATTLLGRLYIHLDLSNPSEPISVLTETGATLTPPITDQWVNITNGVYEINLATFTVSTSTIGNLVNVFPTIGATDSIEVTLATTGWVFNAGTGEYEQTVYNTAIFATSRPTQGIIYPNPCTAAARKATQKAASLIVGMETSDGSVTFRATSAPAYQLTIGLGV